VRECKPQELERMCRAHSRQRNPSDRQMRREKSGQGRQEARQEDRTVKEKEGKEERGSAYNVSVICQLKLIPIDDSIAQFIHFPDHELQGGREGGREGGSRTA
jgi:hypothetical protein